VFEMIDHLERAETHFQAWDDRNGLGVCKLAFGVIARLSGSPDDALALFEEARGCFIEGGYEWGLASAHYYAGEALRDLGQREAAVERLREGLRRYWAQGDNWGAGGVISALACLAADDGEDERAAQFFGGADALLAKIGAFLPPTDLDAYRAAAGQLRARMGETAYTGAYAAGQATPPERLVAEALSEPAAADSPDGASPNVRLTRRQALYVRELAAGFDLQTIARRQKRSPSSVYEIVQRICDRLGLGSWEEIAPFARANGLIAAPTEKSGSRAAGNS
jgi:DNA-binding CsgD family transcriptional regulator